MRLDSREFGLGGVVGAPLLDGQHRVEAFAIEVAMVDLVAALAQRRHDRIPQCRGEAVVQRVGIDDEDPHRASLG